MKMRTLIILLLALGVVAAAAALTVHRGAQEHSGGIQGTLLMEELPANQVAAISITSAHSTVSLRRGDERWVVENRFNYPADFSRIAELVRTVKASRIGRQFESSGEILARLALRDPDEPEAPATEKATRIVMKDRNGEPLCKSILLGKPRRSGTETRFPNGQYVRLGRESSIYLIDTHFTSLPGEPSGWLDRELVHVTAGAVKKIGCLSADGTRARYSLERAGTDAELEPVEVPAGWKVKRSTVNRLAGALSSLRLSDVVSPARAAELTTDGAFPVRLEYELFDGTVYRIFPGTESEEADGCHLRLEVDYRRPPSEAAGSEEASPEKGAAAETSPEERAREAEHLNERLSPWVFMVPRWQHSAFVLEKEQLLEKRTAGAKAKGKQN
jgi:hypothetical protein